MKNTGDLKTRRERAERLEENKLLKQFQKKEDLSQPVNIIMSLIQVDQLTSSWDKREPHRQWTDAAR